MITEKERKVKELIDEHVNKVGECLGSFKDCFEAFFQGDRERSQSIHANCDHAETEADILRREIGDYLYSGAFLPIERKDIYMLTEFIDKIANRAETASDVVVYQTPEVPEDYKKTLHEIVETMVEMFRILQDAVRHLTYDATLESEENLAAMREKISLVGVMESEIDKKEEVLMRTIFRSELPLANKIQLERFLRRVTEISDVIEDAADRLYVLVIRERI
ncbi:MAG: TIGR00153 family protein [Deltaproteobacteria bacterium]|nr:TIGR00153 family protein [Deltaproteobacteria bacterium]MBW1794957.1 TIGR00153 family protein [Deltaproteobacteria bacterium]